MLSLNGGFYGTQDSRFARSGLGHLKIFQKIEGKNGSTQCGGTVRRESKKESAGLRDPAMRRPRMASLCCDSNLGASKGPVSNLFTSSSSLGSASSGARRLFLHVIRFAPRLLRLLGQQAVLSPQRPYISARSSHPRLIRGMVKRDALWYFCPIMGLSVGIVGLPNVGKSTLFNALTKKGVPAENYPFCTIDPSVGIVAVPDHR